MMKSWYSIEVAMSGENERTYELDQEIGETLGFDEDHIDERETYRMTAVFESQSLTSVMRVNVRQLLRQHPEIHYIDVIFRRGNDLLPDRFVIWQDGRELDYRGRIVYEEVY